MVDIYTVACAQSNRLGVSHRSEIMEFNLKRVLELVDYCGREGRVDFPVFAPVKLVLFPEVFIQGWCYDPTPYSTQYEKVAKDTSIQIPGEETNLLAEKAKQYKIYIAGTAHEVIPELSPDYAFNCGFIIDPRGEIIYKYHKIAPYLPSPSDDISPHDVYDRYIEVMDGKYGRKKGDILSCFFPVIETDIGKLGYIICNDGFTFEHSRAMAVQGCEVMLRSSGIFEPQGSPPQQHWEIQNRAAAQFNLMYVVACGPGDFLKGGRLLARPAHRTPGHTMIVDYHGAIIWHADYHGETAGGAVIEIETLRKRRTDPKHNWVTQLRTEAFREAYNRTIYEKNLFLDKPPTNYKDRIARQPVKRFLEERIFIPPST